MTSQSKMPEILYGPVRRNIKREIQIKKKEEI